MHGRLVAANRVEVSDGFSANRSFNVISGTFIKVCALLWVLVVILEASSLGEIFCSCFAIQKYYVGYIQV